MEFWGSSSEVPGRKPTSCADIHLCSPVSRSSFSFNMYKSPLLAIFRLSLAISLCTEFLGSFINMQTKPHNIIDINLQVFRIQGIKLMSFIVLPQELTGLSMTNHSLYFAFFSYCFYQTCSFITSHLLTQGLCVMRICWWH